MNDQLLKFGKGNAKLNEDIYTFSIPSGYTCPGAKLCKSYANRLTGKMTDGRETLFRCFSASQEAAFPSVRNQRWHNYDLLRECNSPEEMRDLILASLPRAARIIRIHVGGDFYSVDYFRAWALVAFDRPLIKFYAYTKSIDQWLALKGEIPVNFILTASEGGKFDHLIGDHKRAKVVFSEEQAAALGLAIDHDDSHAYEGTESFALLLHGTQPKGTESAKALSALKHSGVKYSYPRKMNVRSSKGIKYGAS
jgi:hypothetical protein